MATISSSSSQNSTTLGMQQFNHQQMNFITEDLSQSITKTCEDLLKNNGRTLESEANKIKRFLSKYMNEIRKFDEDEKSKKCEALLKSTQEEIDIRVSTFYREHPELYAKYFSSSSSSSISGSHSISSVSSSSSSSSSLTRSISLPTKGYSTD